MKTRTRTDYVAGVIAAARGEDDEAEREETLTLLGASPAAFAEDVTVARLILLQADMAAMAARIDNLTLAIVAMRDNAR